MVQNMHIYVNKVLGSQMAAKITGKFTLDGHEFRFMAIAFGRIGGQNIGAKLSKTTKQELKLLGYDPEDILLEIQSKLLRGDMTIPDDLKRESFADG